MSVPKTVLESTTSPPLADARVAESVAWVFRSVHRNRRTGRPSTYRPDRLLSLWCAWEAVRDVFAREVAEDVIHGYTHSVAEDGERYRLAVERHDRARARYLARDRDQRPTAAVTR